jgi:hypothetical protein
MKKPQLTILICALLVIGLSPLSNANNPRQRDGRIRAAKTQSRSLADSTDLAAGFDATLLRALLRAKRIEPPQNSEPGTDANSAEPGKQVSSATLPRTAPAVLKVETDNDERDEPLSDIDSISLRELKRHAAAPQQKNIASDSSIEYSAKEDDAVAKSNILNPSLNITPAPLAPNPVQSFTGVTDADQLDGFLHTPPDTNMAAGPSHVMTVVNSMFAIYSKAGTVISTSSLKSWFDNVCTNCSVFDPRIEYDPGAARWIMMALYKDASSQSKILISVSQTSDPTGSWWNYSLNAVLNYSTEDTWADYPDVGFDGIPAASGGAIYITVNQFTFTARSFRTAVLYILPKSALYSGAALSYWRAWDRKNGDNSQAFTYRASKTYGNPGGEFLINTRNNGSIASLWRVNPTYPPTAVDWTLQSTINIGSYSVAPNASQPGTTDLLDTLDNRMYNAVWQNNRIYAAFTEAHDWGSGTVAALRYLKINTSSNSAEINETFGADGLHYYNAAIATDSSDNIVIVFSRSNSTEYAGARYTGRLTTDSGAQGSSQLKAGTATLFKSSDEDQNRWGDYQAVAIDPFDGTKVWIYGQWAVDLPGISNDYDWGTWIGQVQFSGTVTGGTAGLYNPAGAGFFLRNSNSSGVADIAFAYGPAGAGWLPLVGDWNGDGVDTVGLYNPAGGSFFLRNSNSSGVADIAFAYGPAGAGWLPLVGDWNGDGVDTVGLYNPTSGGFFLRNSNSTGVADITFAYGPGGAGWKPLVGDWNGDGTPTVGLYNPTSGGFFLRNNNSTGVADIAFSYGPSGAGWLPLVGDWNSDGTATVGLYNPASGGFFLRNSNSTGVADITFAYGPAGAGWKPLVGDWNGL